MHTYQRSTVSYICFTHLRQFTLRLDSTFHIDNTTWPLNHIDLYIFFLTIQFNLSNLFRSIKQY